MQYRSTIERLILHVQLFHKHAHKVTHAVNCLFEDNTKSEYGLCMALVLSQYAPIHVAHSRSCLRIRNK